MRQTDRESWMFQAKLTSSQDQSFLKKAINLCLCSFAAQIILGEVVGIWSAARELPSESYHQLTQHLSLVETLVFSGLIYGIIGGGKLFQSSWKWSKGSSNLIHLNLALSCLLIILNGLFDNIVTMISGGWPLTWSSFIGAATAGIGEEAWLRGIFFTAFLLMFSKKKGVLLKTALATSLLFGSLHLLNLLQAGSNPLAVFQQVFYATAFGLLLAVIRVGYNNLWLPMLLHFLIDFKPTIHEPVVVNEWLIILLIFIPQAFLSLATLVKMDKDLGNQQNSVG